MVQWVANCYSERRMPRSPGCLHAAVSPYPSPDTMTLALQTASLLSHTLRISVHGIVQGVGFRPFVYRLAHRCNLAGTVTNNGDGVSIHVSGPAECWKPLLPPSKPKHRRLPVSTASRCRRLNRRRRIPPSVSCPVCRGAAEHPDRPGYRPLRRLSARDHGPGQPPVRLPLHQLHQLRSSLFHCRAHSLRPAQHLDARLPHVPRSAVASTTIRLIAVSTPNPTPARSAVRS
jgi:hypothetical protein